MMIVLLVTVALLAFGATIPPAGRKLFCPKRIVVRKDETLAELCANVFGEAASIAAWQIYVQNQDALQQRAAGIDIMTIPLRAGEILKYYGPFVDC